MLCKTDYVAYARFASSIKLGVLAATLKWTVGVI